MRNFKDTMEYVYINSGTHCDYVEEYEQSDDNGYVHPFMEMIEDAANSMVFMGVQFAFEKTIEDVCIQLCNILLKTTRPSTELNRYCDFGHSIKKSVITKAKKEFNVRKKELIEWQSV